VRSVAGEPVAIVLAWVDMTGIHLTGRYVDRYKTVREVKAVEAAKTCMWLNRGTADDVAKARVYAESIAKDYLRVGVYTFPVDEQDPRAKAAALILGGGR
jgi:hypothetical protein